MSGMLVQQTGQGPALLVVVVVPQPLLNRVDVGQVERIDPLVNGRRVGLDRAHRRELAQVPCVCVCVCVCVRVCVCVCCVCVCVW
jgi:hypothetical protein